MTRKKNRYKKAFTFIEMLVVVALITILTTVLIPKSSYSVNEAKRSGSLKNQETLESIVTSEYEYIRYTTVSNIATTVYNNISQMDAIKNMINPLNKEQKGVALVEGNEPSIEDKNKAALVFTENPIKDKIPDGVAYIVIGNNQVGKEIQFNTFSYDIVDQDKNINSNYTDYLNIITNNRAFLLGASQSTGTSLDIPNRLTNVGVKSVAISKNITFFVNMSGDLYVKNTAKLDAAGNKLALYSTFTKILENVRAIYLDSVTERVAYAIMNDGKVMVAGTDSTKAPIGFLQTGTIISSSSVNYFREVPGLTDIKYISVNSVCTFAVDNRGQVYACGQNSNYMLGNTEAVNTNAQIGFKLLTSINDVKKVKNNGMTTLFLTNSGKVYTCGFINWEDRKSETNPYTHFKINVASKTTASYTKNIELVTDINDVVDIEANSNAFYLLNNIGEVYVAGLVHNYLSGQPYFDGYISSSYINGVLKIPITNVREIALGNYVGFFIKNDGSIYAVGINKDNLLPGMDTPMYTPTLLPKDISTLDKLYSNY